MPILCVPFLHPRPSLPGAPQVHRGGAGGGGSGNKGRAGHREGLPCVNICDAHGQGEHALAPTCACTRTVPCATACACATGFALACVGGATALPWLVCGLRQSRPWASRWYTSDWPGHHYPLRAPPRSPGPLGLPLQGHPWCTRDCPGPPLCVRGQALHSHSHSYPCLSIRLPWYGCPWCTLGWPGGTSHSAIASACACAYA